MVLAMSILGVRAPCVLVFQKQQKQQIDVFQLPFALKQRCGRLLCVIKEIPGYGLPVTGIWGAGHWETGD